MHYEKSPDQIWREVLAQIDERMPLLSEAARRATDPEILDHIFTVGFSAENAVFGEMLARMPIPHELGNMASFCAGKRFAFYVAIEAAGYTPPTGQISTIIPATPSFWRRHKRSCFIPAAGMECMICHNCRRPAWGSKDQIRHNDNHPSMPVVCLACAERFEPGIAAAVIDSIGERKPEAVPRAN